MKTFLFFLLAFSIIITSCKKSESPVEPGDDKTIKTGDVVDLTTQSVGTGGGEINITRSGDPLNGMKITIPPGSFSAVKNINVSYAPIIKHNLGDDFNPISPLIKIKYEGGYADSIMMLKIPIKLPAGHFAMGFFYDETTEKLEGLMLEDLTDNFITVSTRHFSSKTKIGKRLIPSDEISEGSMIITSILESKLAGHPVIATGFDPGFDDWEFPNWGSYIAPDGHCAGQSITAIWYYYEKRLRGAKDLFHGYDKIYDASYPPLYFWYDNPKGYRFASVIQEESDYSTWMEKMDFQIRKPKNTFYTIINAMLKTGEPQLIGIRRTTPDTAGHAVIVYKIDPILKKMYVADPNFPGNRPHDKTSLDVRVIEFDGTKFLPYQSMDNVGNPISSFDQIGYFGKTAFIDWGKIKNRWTDFENGTIGNGKFPTYYLKDKTKDINLVDGMSFDKDTLKIIASSSEVDGTIGDRLNQPIEVYDTNGVYLAQADLSNGGVAVIKLKPGLNKFGVYVQGMKRLPTRFITPYVDFKWISVYYSTLKINPDPLNGEPDKSYTFTATITGGPSNAKYVWTFGDDSPSVTKTNDNSVSHTYTKEGTFTVQVKLYDNSTGNLVATATSTAKIAKPPTLDIQKTKSITIQLYGADRTFSNPSLWISELSISSYDYFIKTGNKMVWSGLNFSHDINYQVGDMYDTVYYTGTIYGTVSADGSTLVSLYGELHQRTWKYNSTYDQKIQVVNMPFNNITSMSIQANAHGTGVGGYVTTYDQRRRSWNSSTSSYEEVYITSITYTSTTQLFISFSKY